MTAAHEQPPEEPGTSASASAGADAAEQKREPERCGPLLVERHHKADGRQLILYRRVADDG